MNASEIAKIRYLSAPSSSISSICYSSALYAEISEEITLPEYISDVRRVLMSDSSVCQSECIISDSKIECEGKVLFNVLLYTDSGEVKGYSMSLPYSAVSQALGGDQIIAGHICFVSIEQSSAKLTNSRKLAVKCRVKTDVRAYGKVDSLPTITGTEKEEDESYVERDTESIEVMKTAFCQSESFAISDDIELENTLPEIEDILCCRAGALLCSVREADGDSAMCDGEMEITVFYTDADKKVQCVTRRQKYSAMCDIGDVGQNCEYAANLFLHDIHAQASKNSFGENRIIELDINGSLGVFAAANSMSEITRDAYSTEHKCQNTFADFRCPTLLRLGTVSFTQSVSKSVSDISAKAPAKIVCSSAALRGTKIGYDSDRDRGYIEGNAEITVLARDDGGEIYPINVSASVKYDLDTAFGKNYDALITANVSNLSARFDSGKIYCDFNVSANVFICSDSDRHILCECRLEEAKENAKGGKKSSMTVCYGKAGERLWDIAKHYSTTIDAISSVNGIASDRLESDSVMIIPQKKKGVTRII